MSATLDRRQRARGALVGAVVGDAFGGLLEGAATRDVERLVRARLSDRAPWKYTDDGAVLVALAESIRETGTVVPGAFLARLAERYDPVRGFGRGMKIAIDAFERGVPWPKVAFQAWPEGSRGNGGAVRVGAVALRRWTGPTALFQAASLATRVTHAHPVAVDAARLQVAAAHLVLTEPHLADSPDLFVDALESLLPEAPALVGLIPKLRDLGVGRASAARIAGSFGTSTLANESVPAAICSFLVSHQSFASAIGDAARLGGDVDSMCAMVGFLTGALHGLAAIPSTWLDNLRADAPSPAELCALADHVDQLEPIGFADPGG